MKQLSTLGKAIEHFQNEAAISTYRISLLTGITQATLSRLKHGKANSSIETVERICKVLNIKLSDLFLKYEEFEA